MFKMNVATASSSNKLSLTQYHRTITQKIWTLRIMMLTL